MSTSRRELLKGMAVGAAGSAWLSAGGAVEAAPKLATQQALPGQDVSSYPFGANLWVRVDGRPFTCYRANQDQKGPYFFPIYGPATGLPMTEEAGEPYPHHRSLFFGCDAVNGYNFWQTGNDRGQIVSRGPQEDLAVKDSSRTAAISDVCDWRVPGQKPIIEDTRRFEICAPSADLGQIYAHITLKALADIHVKTTNHSFFALRCDRGLAPAGGGKLINSKGDSGEKATYGKPAAWCGFEGTRLGVTESIVMLDHPKNPWGPDCPWFTRDYGFISPTRLMWVDAGGWRLRAGEAIALRYQVLVMKGRIEKDRVDPIWQEFART
jgi:hypothetical protein